MSSAATGGPRVLHLFANYKWTGPADPAIRTALGLRELGVDVVFAQADYCPGGNHWMREQLTRCRMPVVAGLDLRKHASLGSLWHDSRALAARQSRDGIEVVHAHLPGDHLPAAFARRRSADSILVRSLYDPEPPSRWPRNRLAFRSTDGVVVPTRSCAAAFLRRWGFPESRVLVQEPTTDVDRFSRLSGDMRGQWGVAPSDVLIGITARVQPHRRFPFLWQVARKVVDAVPEAKFVLLGRGNEKDVRELIDEPIGALGLRDHVLLPGYLKEPEYSLALRSLDLFTFLVPGSDGTCRAVREALAAGLPVVTTKRGILPELVGRRDLGPGQAACGLLIEDDVGLMSAAMISLIRNEAARVTLREAALDRVRSLMDPRRASAALLAFYEELLRSRAR